MSGEDGVAGWYGGPDNIEARIETTIRRHELNDAERYGRNREVVHYPPVTIAEILAFEETWARTFRSKEEGIRVTFHGRPASRYFQLMNRAIDTKEALELNPMLVNRLREQREARLKARATRTFRPTR